MNINKIYKLLYQDPFKKESKNTKWKQSYLGKTIVHTL